MLPSAMSPLVLCALLLVPLIPALPLDHQLPHHHPVIIVPGLGGSQLWYSHDLEDDIAWINPEFLLTEDGLRYFVDLMKLNYNRQTHTTYNQKNVEVVVPGFGNTNTVESLSIDFPSMTYYFYALVDGLVQQGYRRGEDVRAAPYDFRKAPNEMEDLLRNITTLIEQTVHAQNSKAVIVCHSMGCLVTQTLLSGVGQRWKNNHVEALVTLGAPWEGAVKSLAAVISGVNFGINKINPKLIREFVRTLPSFMYHFPTRKLWGDKEPLVETRRRNYTSHDLLQLMADLGSRTMGHMLIDVSTARVNLRPPGVKTVCFHGTGLATEARLKYLGPDGLNGEPEIEHEDGDGTVNIRNHEICEGWQKDHPQQVQTRALVGASHLDMIYHEEVLKTIYDLAMPKNQDATLNNVPVIL